MDKPASDSQSDVFSDFERISRTLRWLCIGVVLATFPHVQPQIKIIYVLAVLAVAFNLSRYSRTLLRWRPYALPLTVLTVDGIFIGLLLALAGSVTTPYSAFLLFTVITAAYQYGLRGALIASGLQTVWLFIIVNWPLFSPVILETYQDVILSAFVLVALGVLIERLTRSDREQRIKLEKLSHENAAERSRLLALVNSVKDAVFVVDEKGSIMQHNEVAATLAGKTGDLHGKSFAQLLPLHVRVDPEAKPLNLLRDHADTQHRRDLSLQAEHGIVYDLDIRVTPILLPGRKSTDYIIVCQDITKERTLDEQRKEFISVASHELRTPLAIMEAALSAALLDKTKLNEQIVALLQQAHDNTMYLGGIVKDLALLAEAQNDNLPIELTQVNPKSLLNQLVKDFSIQARQQGLELNAVTDPETPTVLSTENHIKEILQNYVNNALKYTKKGSITMKAKPSKNNGVLFSVQDSGIGISPTDQKHLFTKFFRAEDYRTRLTGGNGLGLYLCQELAVRLNGTVWCESVLDKGSTFYLEVPPFSHLQRDRGEVLKAQVSNLVEEL